IATGVCQCPVQIENNRAHYVSLPCSVTLLTQHGNELKQKLTDLTLSRPFPCCYEHSEAKQDI
ncbi:MAG: hypothetical protein AAGA78_03095, partial [Pseudomonadota bacterium]